MKWLTIALMVIVIAMVGCTQQAPVQPIQVPVVDAPVAPVVDAPQVVEPNPSAGDADIIGQSYGAGCLDTDSPKSTDQGSSLNTAVKGTSTDATGATVDSCSSDRSVMEAYCQGGVTRVRDINCRSESVCLDGACVSESDANMIVSQAAAETGVETA